MRTHWQTHAHTNTGKHLWYIYIHKVTRLYTYTLACMLCILHIAYRCVHICSCLKNELQMHTHWQTHAHTNTGKHLWYIYIHIVTRLYTHTLACMLCILHIAYECVHNHMFEE